MLPSMFGDRTSLMNEPAGEVNKFYSKFPEVGTHPQDPAQKKAPGLVTNVWEQEKQRQKFPMLDKDVACDVLVIGAGIMGINIAYNLVKAGKNVVVLEGRVRAAGQSGRTSAHIMQWWDDYYHIMEKKFGLEGAKIQAESQCAAADFIEKVVREEKIDCDFTRLNGYLVPHERNSQAYNMLETEGAACRRAGLHDVKMVDLGSDPQYGSFDKALIFPRSAEFHPIKYINGVADAIERCGGRIFEMTRVSDRFGPIVHGKVLTDTGYTVTAREAVVFATNSPINRNPGIHIRQAANRTYMLGLKVPKGSVARANWWDTNEIYHYTRIQPGHEFDTLLIGGEDHQTGQRVSKYYDAWAKLEEYARKRWPQCQEVVYRWSGQVYEPVDQVHYFGLDPYSLMNATDPVKRYIATGDSGQGMTGSAIAAMVIGDLILGRPNPWAQHYAPSRLLTALAPSSLEEFASEVLVSARGWSDVVVPRSTQDVQGLFNPKAVEDKLSPGEGTVVQEGTHKVALYKDQDGKVHRCSAICPHLGCCVEWNPMDCTFDCCCHGSQFDRYGININGPAISNLKKLDW